MSEPDHAADLETFLSAAADQLAEAGTHSRLQDDPLRLPFQALSLFMRAQWRVFSEWRDKTHEAVNEEILSRAVTRGVQNCARNAVQALHIRNSLIGAGLLVGALIIGAGSGYWFGYQDGITSADVFKRLSSSEAGTWARLMADNPGNVAESLVTCVKSAQHQPNGRRACPMPVWIDPPVPQTP